MRVLRRVSLLVVVALALTLAPVTLTHAQGTTYVVQPGDNLFRISLRFGTTVSALAQANNISNPSLIFVGQTLIIPNAAGGTPVPTNIPGTTPTPGTNPGATYTVQSGDTLSRVAVRFGTTVAAIAQANNIVNVNLIFVGQVLVIPGGTVPVSTTPGAPPPVSGGFELGGQALTFTGDTQTVMHSAHMKWVKFQIASGDGNGPNLVAAAHGTGFKVLFSVVTDKAQVLDAGYRSGYAQYLASLASAGADAIEVGNEQNIDREWPTGQVSPTSYVGLLQQAYSAIKSANSSTLVISGALAPTGYFQGSGGKSANGWDDDVYYAGMAAAGAGNYADCIGVHYNEGIISPVQNFGDPRDNYPTRYWLGMLNRALASFPGKKACYTELGYLTPEGYGPLPAGFTWAQNTTVAEQAQWLAQAASLSAQSGRVRLLIVFNVDFTEYGADPQAGYAIVRAGGGCPACSQLASVIP
ncbi:MAG TPA: LysM peptidoglycan-binding domain-containing protein [Aggregatilineales bacterium]|nr:LysM peptidoglycan-binding domain-containing protein [Aggregatilineales bacterium]